LRSALLGAALLFAGPASAEEKSFALRIENGKVPATMRVLKVRRGDTVRFDVSTDRAAVLHIHGLRIEIVAAPDKPGVASFAASATGRFPIELHAPGETASHHHGPPLAHLEVHPR
jgi:precorrin-4 methylase